MFIGNRQLTQGTALQRIWRLSHGPRAYTESPRIGHDLAHNFLAKRTCCRFAQVIGITSDPKITFPYFIKICASTLRLCVLSAGFRTSLLEAPRGALHGGRP